MLIETTRLRLREMTCDDAPFLHELMNDPGYIANVADRGIRTHDDARRWIMQKILPSYQRHGFGSYLVELKEAGAAVGSCGLIKREALDDVDIGYAILERFTGKGYAYESAAAVMAHGRKVFALPRIIGLTSPANAVSIHLLKKLGLQFEKMVQLPEFENPSMLFS